jgi:peptide/nickel transport system substrate-binding protein
MCLSALTATGIVLTACGSEQLAEVPDASPPADAPAAAPAAQVAATQPTQFNEAPMLAELVAGGELPPVDQRLPANPTVVPVVAEIGNYGGALRRAFKGVSDRWGPTKVQDSSLIRYDLELNKHPDLIESWEQNEDATEFTLHLRQGLRWSDGVEFDSSAFTWWYENRASNATLTPALPRNYSTGDPYVLMTLSAPDKYTVTLQFAHPKPLFIDFMSRDQPFTPGHYMQEFHIDLTSDPEGLEAAVAEAGFETWDQYYLDDRESWFLNPEKPTVGPWRAMNALSEELFIMERNPYFHQVDPEGNQLPYIDHVHHRLFSSDEVFNLWIINGEIDFQNRHVSIANYTLFKESEAAGNFQVLLGTTSGGETLSINHATKNERLAEFFQNRDVRIALNVAVDREAINELVFDGLGVPRQASPHSQSPQYHEGATQAHAFYDPEMANEVLDQAGYSERNSEGFRLWNDGSGEVISFVVEGIDTTGSPSADTLNLVLGYFREVGVQANYKSIERTLYEERWEANEIEAAWWGAGHDITPFLSHSVYYIGELLDRPWAGAWGRWYRDRDDPNGAAPPDGHFLWEMWEIWAEAVVEPDEATRNSLFAQIMDIWAEEVPVVGIVGELPGPIIAHSDLANLVDGFILQDATRDESLINPAQLFWLNPEEHV